MVARSITRFEPLMRLSGWVLPLRQAAGMVASVADSDAPFRRPHGTALRGERRMGGPDLACDPSNIYVGASAAMLRAAAQRRQGPGSSDGRFGTLRVAIGWPSESGRDAAVSPRRSHSVPLSQTMIWMRASSPPSCGVGGVRGRQRSAISPSARDGPSRRAAHGLSGLGVRSEQYICGCVRCDAESRRTAAARSGIFGWTIRDPSCLPSDGRRNPADPRPNLRGEATRFLPLMR